MKVKKKWMSWTETEDKILRKRYFNTPWGKLLKLLKGKRTRSAICIHAEVALGLSRENALKKPYTGREKEVIRKNYGVAPREKILKLLPGRNWEAIRMMAVNTLGLSRQFSFRSWEKKDIAQMKKAILSSRKIKSRQEFNHFIDKLSLSLNRTAEAIAHKMRELRLKWLCGFGKNGGLTSEEKRLLSLV